MDKDLGDFPGAPMVKNLPCNVEDEGSLSGGEAKIPRAVEQLSSFFLRIALPSEALL